MNDAAARERPVPGLGAALLLTLLGSIAVALATRLLRSWMPPNVAAALGLAVGFGVAGVLVALRIPPPHGERIGLRPLPRLALGPLLLLVPGVFLGSELDNWLRSLLPARDAVRIVEQREAWLAAPSALGIVETLVIAAGIAPIVEEWFFRGLLQQGLVARFGSPLGVFFAALLFALPHGDPTLSFAAWGAVVVAALAYGVLLGSVRELTGSLLAPIVLHAAFNAVQVAAVLAQAHVPVAGFNAPGEHTSFAVLVPAALSVTLGIWLLTRIAPAARSPGAHRADE